jgi:hypothetical protein
MGLPAEGNLQDGRQRGSSMRNPSKPDTQLDQYMPDLAYAHKSGRDHGDVAGINPREPSTMPRGEEDAKTLAESPEYHDRTDVPQAGTSAPPRR